MITDRGSWSPLCKTDSLQFFSLPHTLWNYAKQGVIRKWLSWSHYIKNGLFLINFTSRFSVTSAYYIMVSFSFLKQMQKCFGWTIESLSLQQHQFLLPSNFPISTPESPIFSVLAYSKVLVNIEFIYSDWPLTKVYFSLTETLDAASNFGVVNTFIEWLKHAGHYAKHLEEEGGR